MGAYSGVQERRPGRDEKEGSYLGSQLHPPARAGWRRREVHYPYPTADVLHYGHISKDNECLTRVIYTVNGIFGCRLKSLGEGKVWSSSAPNLGKSPKHVPITGGFSSLNEMGESEKCENGVDEFPQTAAWALALVPPARQITGFC